RGHREQVVGRPDVERLAGVELDITGDGVVVDRRWQVRRGQRARSKVVAANANVAKARIALMVIARPNRAPVIGDDTGGQIGLLRSNRRGAENLILPGGGRPLGVERGEQIAADAAEVGAVWFEAEGDEVPMRPGIARCSVRNDTGFELLNSQLRPMRQGGTR